MSDVRSRRELLRQLGTLVATIAASKWVSPSVFAQTSAATDAPLFAYVGCFTTAERGAIGEGINVYRVDPASGNWEHVQLLGDLASPSFLAIDRESRFLYSVHADEPYTSAFAIDPASGRLTFLNRQDNGGTNGVHLAVDPSNRFVVVSNYASGSMAVLPINPDGSLGPRSDLVDLPGEPGPHPTQQTSSHPHHNPFDPQGRFLLVPDKGLDRVFVFGLDEAGGRLVWADTPFITVQPGAGPRHADFHPMLPVAYLLNELDSTLAVFAYDSQTGGLEQRQLLSTLPDDFGGTNTTAEIAVHGSGRFLYCSNRGHDSIAAFSIDQTSGLLTRLGWTPTGGERPRYFGFDPSGTFLYAANEVTHTIVTFRVDSTTGELSPTGQVVETGSPVTIVFGRPTV